MKFIDVGYKNFVNSAMIVSVTEPKSSPIKRTRMNAEDEGKYIDVTMGKLTKSIIITKTHVIGSALEPSTIIKRMNE